VLPSTTTKGAQRSWPLFALVAVALVALALLVEAFLRAESFSPGEEISAPTIRDVSVSEQDRLYPPPDVGRFRERPETVFVYLTVDDLPNVEDLEARVEKSGNASVFGLLFGRGAGIEAVDEQEDQLSSDDGGASGIVKFALRTRSGEPVPPGNYTLEIHGAGGSAAAARKSFVVEG